MRAEPPVPEAPADLAATLSVPSIAALYAGVRALVPSRAGALPASPELASAAGLGLPLPVANALVLERPAAGALLVGDGGAAELVVACPLRSGRELLLSLGSGTPALEPTVDAKSGLSTFTATDGAAFGILGDWLVLATTPHALGAAGPYVARVLASRPPAASALRVDVVAAAFPRLARALSARWQATRALLASLAARAQADAGRPADFADPEVILKLADSTVASVAAHVASSRAASLTLSFGPARAELALELTPAAGGSASAALARSVTGSLEPLLALPRETVVGVLARAPEQAPPANETVAAGALASVLASKLPANEQSSFASVFALLARGLGKTTVLGLLPDASAVAESELGDADALAHAELGLVAAVNAPAARGPLAPFFGKRPVHVRADDVAGFDGPVHRVVFPVARGGERDPELAWGLRAHEVFATLGHHDTSALAALASEPPPATLGADPELRAAAQRHPDAAFAVAANLGALAGAPAHLLFACGKHGEAERFELELGGAAPALVGRLAP